MRRRCGRRAALSVSKVKRQDKNRQPAPPFTTSTLQQEASRKLNMTPARTMSIAQQLYEGVDITGEGTVGLITYMRTDSLRLSEEAIAAARGFIARRYGQDYYPAQPRRFKAKGNAQDAHEAIRPSDVTLVPEDIKKDLTSEQYQALQADLEPLPGLPDGQRRLRQPVHRGGERRLHLPGQPLQPEVLRLHRRVRGGPGRRGGGAPQSPLPDLKEGEPLEQKGLKKDQHFTQPPARYSEATLIRALEEKGIGRPSTYAPTISTILNREYVVKEGQRPAAHPPGRGGHRV